MKKLILIITFALIPNIVFSQIEMLNDSAPIKVSEYVTAETAYLSLYKMEPSSENDCTETCYFIVYRDTELRGNYENIFLGDLETTLSFRDLIFESFSLEDFIDDEQTKQTRFRIEDQTITIVRQFQEARYFEHLDRELPDRISIYLNINYGAYIGSTFNSGITAWEELFEYFD